MELPTSRIHTTIVLPLNTFRSLDNGSRLLLDPFPQRRLSHSGYEATDDTYSFGVMVI